MSQAREDDRAAGQARQNMDLSELQVTGYDKRRYEKHMKRAWIRKIARSRLHMRDPNDRA